MNFPAFADTAHPITWPEEHRAAASFTFDVDAESCTIAHDPKSTRAECYPDVVRRIADGGHEIAHHGYLHEPMQGIDAATERVTWTMAWMPWPRPPASARRATAHPGGSSTGTPRHCLPTVDSSMTQACSTATPPTASALPRETPATSWRYRFTGPWTTGSSTPSTPASPEAGVIESPAKVLEMWTLEAEAHHAAGSCFVLTNHPFISGRPSKAVALEQLMDRVKSMDGMWVTTMEKIAQRLRFRPGNPHSCSP